MLRYLKASRYFKKHPSIGLDIGTDEIRLLQLKSTSDGFQIEKLICQKLPTEAALTGSDIYWKSVEALLSHIVSESKLSNATAVLAIPNHQVLQKQIQLPASIHEEDLQKEIKERLIEYFPNSSPQELYFDFMLGQTRDEMHSLSLLAARHDVMQLYLQAATRSGLNVSIADVDLYARVRAGSFYFSRQTDVSGNAAAWLDLHWPFATMMVFLNGTSVFQHAWQVHGLGSGLGLGSGPRFFQELKAVWQMAVSDCASCRIEWMGISGFREEHQSMMSQIEEQCAIPVRPVDPLSVMTHASSLDPVTIKSASTHFLLCAGLAMRGAHQE